MRSNRALKIGPGGVLFCVSHGTPQQEESQFRQGQHCKISSISLQGTCSFGADSLCVTEEPTSKIRSRGSAMTPMISAHKHRSTYTRARTRERETAHLTSRTYGKRQPSVRQATRVPTEAFSSDSRGPSTSSRVQRGHLHTHTQTRAHKHAHAHAHRLAPTGKFNCVQQRVQGCLPRHVRQTLREEGLRGRLCVPASKIFRLSPRL